MAETRTYEGGCHCGRVRYRIETSPLTQAVECNCSICSKRGTLLTFVKAPQFTLLKGDDALAEYQFAKKQVHHLFCDTCGVGSYSHGIAPSGEDTYAVNVRCLNDVDISKLKIRPFDGKSL